MAARNRMKGPRPKQIPPAPRIEGATFEEDYNYQMELCWCIQKLQLGLASTKNPNQVEKASRILKVLQNPNTPKVKKRQTMAAAFGDYRSEMKKEETQRNSSAPSLTGLQEGLQSRVIRRRPSPIDEDSASTVTPQTPFKFNFVFEDEKDAPS